MDRHLEHATYVDMQITLSTVSMRVVVRLTFDFPLLDCVVMSMVNRHGSFCLLLTKKRLQLTLCTLESISNLKCEV